MRLDHLMWAVSDLDAGVDTLQRLTGERAHPGGSHPGNGTCNALLGLGDGCYLEVIAPDREQDLRGSTGEGLAKLSAPLLRRWAIAAGNLSEIGAQMQALGYRSSGPRAMSRRDPNGTLLAWELLLIDGHDLGGAMPFFIDWGNTPHPSQALPHASRLHGLQVTLPDNCALYGWLDGLPEVTLQRGATPRVSARLDTPNGLVELG